MSTLRGRGRPAATDRQSVVDAALTVVERDGADGLTMRAVAEELGVSHATVYRNTQSREHLVELVLQELHRRLPAQMLGEVVEIVRWQDGLLLWAEAAYREARTHPGAMQLLASMRFVPNTRETHELLDRVGVLAEHDGVDLGDVLAAFVMITEIALGLAALDAARSAVPVSDSLDSDVKALAAEHPAAARLLTARAQIPVEARDRLRTVVSALTQTPSATLSS